MEDKLSHFCEGCMAGAEGFEPSTNALETHIAQKTHRFIFFFFAYVKIRLRHGGNTLVYEGVTYDF